MKKNKQVKIFFIIFTLAIFVNITPVSSNELELKTSQCEGCEGYDNDTVLGYWKHNEASGNTTLDSSGNGINGTIVGNNPDMWVNGKLNNCLNFSSDKDDQVNMGNEFGFERTDTFSFEAWLYSYNQTSEYGLIFIKYNIFTSIGWIFLELNHHYLFLMGDSDGKSFSKACLDVSYNNVGWNHIVCTYNGSSDHFGLKMYVNATEYYQPLAQQTLTGSIINAQPFLINGYLTVQWNGLIDNVIIYNKVLTPEEITFQYNNSFGRENYPDTNPPRYCNIITNPIELGHNGSIFLDVCDETSVSSVLIENNGINYTMNNENYTYNYNELLPLMTGYVPYKIWLTDYYDNVQYIYVYVMVINSPLIVLTLCLMFFLVGLMLFLYINQKVPLLILVVGLFSMIIGVMSLSVFMLVYTPYLQLFFITHQSLVLLITHIEIRKERKYNGN